MKLNTIFFISLLSLTLLHPASLNGNGGCCGGSCGSSGTPGGLPSWLNTPKGYAFSIIVIAPLAKVWCDYSSEWIKNGIEKLRGSKTHADANKKLQPCCSEHTH